MPYYDIVYHIYKLSTYKRGYTFYTLGVVTVYFGISISVSRNRYIDGLCNTNFMLVHHLCKVVD